ncbi:DNA-directed RNA polymerase III subunit RPC6-like isoform X2 [Watersipora subatra]|uniref:DNA-directed RNA polymerase III subunit RPC6-like isoform X2 n=1 Tax=Watersipora subatra TaxID=2589382 RepID=UPI00355AE200
MSEPSHARPSHAHPSKQRGKLSLLQSGKILLYKVKSQSENVPGGDNQEKLLYQIISAAGNKGIWVRDIRYKCNLMLTQVNKILKSLESKNLVKSLKSVSAGKKKLYMLYDLTPDRSVTGGAFYSDQEFESEFVDVLTNQCYRFLQNKAEDAQGQKSDPLTVQNASFASGEDMCHYISALGISKVQLTVDDMEMVLNALIYDGKVEKTLDAQHRSLYRAVTSPVNSVSMAKVPCGVCPVSHECEIGGTISPTTCPYLNDWLQF